MKNYKFRIWCSAFGFTAFLTVLALRWASLSTHAVDPSSHFVISRIRYSGSLNQKKVYMNNIYIGNRNLSTRMSRITVVTAPPQR